ncbi:hypothetical protein [Stenotrophomonas pigmentata]|uniref:hypothetical protein n=1 Tax=Stenotrophomonas pigmentata TaxID=3055080 RepID=UPI0026F0143A|nr:hypothetical protein [Stenotrophomonas sp. 610A2]
MSSIDKVFANTIADLCVFLEFSEEKIINPDAAMQAMEQMSASLQELDEDDRLCLLRNFRSISGDYGAGTEEFVGSLGEALGLAE